MHIIIILGTLIRRQFMRGTDPIKSTWVYPNIVKIIILYFVINKYVNIYINILIDSVIFLLS